MLARTVRTPNNFINMYVFDIDTTANRVAGAFTLYSSQCDAAYRLARRLGGMVISWFQLLPTHDIQLLWMLSLIYPMITWVTQDHTRYGAQKITQVDCCDRLEWDFLGLVNQPFLSSKTIHLIYFVLRKGPWAEPSADYRK